MSRAQRAREVQEAIDAAVLRILPLHGVDGLALTKVAEAAGLSNGPLYGRYDSSEDIALDLWDRLLRAHFVQLTTALANWLTDPDASMPTDLVTELESPSPETIAAVEIIAVARRFPLLADSVRDEIERVLETLCAEHPKFPDTILLPAISALVGITMYRGMLPSALVDWPRALGFVRDAANAPDVRAGTRLDAVPVELSIPTATTGDENLDAFVDAVMTVVSRVGFERTTAHRIARAAGHSFSTAYSHAGSKDELMRMAIGAMIAQIINTGDVIFMDLSGEDYVRAVVSLQRGLTADSNRALRQLRVESLLAAAHDEHLGDALRAILSDALGRVSTVFEGSRTAIDDAITTWHLSRAAGMGLVTVSLAAPRLADLDWTPFARVAQHVIERTVFSLVPGRPGAN